MYYYLLFIWFFFLVLVQRCLWSDSIFFSFLSSLDYLLQSGFWILMPASLDL